MHIYIHIYNLFINNLYLNWTSQDDRAYFLKTQLQKLPFYYFHIDDVVLTLKIMKRERQLSQYNQNPGNIIRLHKNKVKKGPSV